MGITIEQVNELLENFTKGELMTDHKLANYHNEKDYGEEGSRIEIRTTNIPGCFIRIEYHNDSYGEREWLHNLKLVKPITKTIIDYE